MSFGLSPALAVKALDHGDFAASDGDERPCLVLAVFEAAFLQLRQGDAESLRDLQAEIPSGAEGENDLSGPRTPGLSNGLPVPRFGNGPDRDAPEDGIDG